MNPTHIPCRDTLANLIAQYGVDLLGRRLHGNFTPFRLLGIRSTDTAYVLLDVQYEDRNEPSTFQASPGAYFYLLPDKDKPDPEPDPYVMGHLVICRGCGAVYPTRGLLANKHPERCPSKDADRLTD